MSNTRSPITPIPLSAPLNLDKLKTDIKAFQGFNFVNAPLFNSCLSPVQEKSLSLDPAIKSVVLDKESNIYTAKVVTISGVNFIQLLKNNTVIAQYQAKDFVRENEFTLDSAPRAVKLSTEGLCVLNSDYRFEFRSPSGELYYTTSSFGSTDYPVLDYTSITDDTLAILREVSGDELLLTIVMFSFSTGSIIFHKDIILPAAASSVVDPFLTHWFGRFHVVTVHCKSGSFVVPQSYTYLFKTTNETFVGEDTPATMSYVNFPSVESYQDLVYPDAPYKDGQVNPTRVVTTAPGNTPTSYPMACFGNITPVSMVYDGTKTTGSLTLTIGGFWPTQPPRWTLVTSAVVSVKYTDSEGAAQTKTHTFSSASTTFTFEMGCLGQGFNITSITVDSVTFSSSYNVTDSTTYPATIFSGTVSSRQTIGIRVLSLVATSRYSEAVICKGFLSLADQSDTTFENNELVVRYYSKAEIRLCSPEWEYSGKTIKQPIPGFYEVTPFSYRIVVPQQQPYYDEHAGNNTYLPTHMIWDFVRDLYYDCPGLIKISDDEWNISYGTFYERREQSSFRVLINSGVPFGISFISAGSYSDAKKRLGVLCSDWARFGTSPLQQPDVDYNFDYGNCACYLSGSTIKYLFTSSVPQLRYVLDRYVIINALRNNLYDTYTGDLFDAFLDYNGSFIPARGHSKDRSWTHSNVAARAEYTNGLMWSDTLEVSALNPLYEISGNPSPGIILPPQLLFGHYCPDSVYNTGQLVNDTDQTVDFFSNDATKKDANGNTITNTVAVYKISNTKRGMEVLSQYKNLSYPINSSGSTQLSIPLLAKYIPTYANADYVMVGTVGYPLQYQDAKPVFTVRALAGISDIQGLFTIQGLQFVVDKRYVYALNMSNSVLVSQDAVVSITGLQFLGATPAAAYFYSPFARALYSFTGSALLAHEASCTDISEVYSSVYNPTTGTLLLSTNKGILALSDKFGAYWLTDTVALLIQCTNKDVLVRDIHEGGDVDYHLYRLCLSEGYTPRRVKLVTSFYGEGNNAVSKVDTLYLRLWVETPAAGSVTVKATTMTDVGLSTEEKTFKIAATDWDKETHSFYLRYQPKYQTSVGVSFTVESDFPIAQMSAGVTPLGVTQIAAHNR